MDTTPRAAVWSSGRFPDFVEEETLSGFAGISRDTSDEEAKACTLEDHYSYTTNETAVREHFHPSY